MKNLIVLIIFILPTIVCSAQLNSNQQAKRKSNQLLTYLRSVPLVKEDKKQAFDFYSIVMHNFYDTAIMKKNFLKSSTKLSLKQMIEIQKAMLWQLHAYTLIVPIIELSVQKCDSDSNFLQVNVRDKSFKHDKPDFYIAVDPTTNNIVAVSCSSSAFKGKEKKWNKLISDK